MNVLTKRRWNVIDVFFIVIAVGTAQYSYPVALVIAVIGVVVSVAAETKHGKN